MQGMFDDLKDLKKKMVEEEKANKKIEDEKEKEKRLKDEFQDYMKNVGIKKL